MFKVVAAFPLVVWLAPLWAQGRVTDSEQILKLLSEAKSEAFILRQDAAELKSFTQSGASWQSHADQLSQIKTHVNKIGMIVQELNDLRIVASPWQRVAIDRVNPLLKELADNTELTITRLNDNPNRIQMPPCKGYVAAYYDLAADLAAMIGDFVDYGKTKAKFEALTRKLELPE